MHSLIQKILVEWLDALGYEAGQEITIKLDPAAKEVWSFEEGLLQKTGTVARRGDRVITAPELWSEVDRVLVIARLPASD